MEVGELADVEAALDELMFPATGSEVVAAVGDREIESVEGSYSIRDLVPEIDEETLPTSRVVRREAAKFCRANGYEIRNDEWLGI